MRSLRHDADIVMQPGTDTRDATRALGPFHGDRWGSRAYRITDGGGRVVARGGLTGALPPSLPTRAQEGVEQVGNSTSFAARSRSTTAPRPSKSRRTGRDRT